MTVPVVIMIIIGMIMIFTSYFISEKLIKKEDSFNVDLLTIDENYEFSERELRIIKRKIEDVIANQAKDILYETNDSLSNMANEKTLALGDYAVAVCEEIERNHKEVMFLYSMLDDKQKEIMNTVREVNEANKNIKEIISNAQRHVMVSAGGSSMEMDYSGNQIEKRQSALDQLTALSKQKKEMEEVPQYEETVKEQVMEEADLEEETRVVAETAKSSVSSESEEDVFAEIDQTEIDFDEALEEEFKENENSNDIILEMHRNGNSIIEIAKQLGLGVGEVKLVIDLYQGE